MKSHLVMASLSLDLTDKTLSSAVAVPHQPVPSTPSFFTCFHFSTRKAENFLVFSLSVPDTFVETQKPLWPWLPQHVLPTNCSSRVIPEEFPCRAHCCPHIPKVNVNKCETALSLSLAVSKYCILTERWLVLLGMQQLHSKEINNLFECKCSADISDVSTLFMF